MTYEENIIAKHNDPRLKRSEFNRQAKKDHLNSQGMAKFPEDRDKILDEMYGPEEPR